MTAFTWWRVNQYGCAEPHAETETLRAQIDEDPRGWYGNVEGTILHGPVIATAFKRTTEPTFDAHAWLETGEMIPAGSVTITKITAEPPRADAHPYISYEWAQELKRNGL